MNARDFFLWAGCIAGIALTLYGAYDAEVPEPMRELSEFPSGSFAVVNGVPLGSKDLGASNSDERSDAFIDQRIEEELLIQKALDLGLLRRTPQVRQHLLSSMSEHIYAGSSKTPPSEAQLKAIALPYWLISVWTWSFAFCNKVGTGVVLGTNSLFDWALATVVGQAVAIGSFLVFVAARAVF